MMPYRPLVCLLYLCGYEVAYGFYMDLFPFLLWSQLDMNSPQPVLKNCPSNIAVTADKGKRSTRVYWTKPTEIHHYRVEHTHQPGDIFYIGKTWVTHVARISNGDYAECSFSITVSVTRCPKMFLSPNVLMLCNHYDQRYGTTCEFECPIDILTITEIKHQSNRYIILQLIQIYNITAYTITDTVNI